MKDALGHGSNARDEGLNADIGHPAHGMGIQKATAPVHFQPEALQYIQQHPGGFSVDARGHAPKDGYMVGSPGRTKIVNESDLRGPHGQEIIDHYVRDNSDALRQPGAHIGGWTDKKSGKTYLDISHRTSDLTAAQIEGHKRNQIAVWDVAHGREIPTRGNGRFFK